MHSLILSQCRDLRTGVMRGFRGSSDGMSKRVLDVSESVYISTMSTVQ